MSLLVSAALVGCAQAERPARNAQPQIAGNGRSVMGSVSADGRYVVFTSAASNLVAGDTNGASCADAEVDVDCIDVFVRDVARGRTERVSVSSRGAQANESSWDPVISADGRYVAFDSSASNLVPADGAHGNWRDVFVRDRRRGTTERVSISSEGVQGNNGSGVGGISADGRYVVFTSEATNLVPGDTNKTCWTGHEGAVLCTSSDVFVRDRRMGTTERVSVSSAGAQANGASYRPQISGDGRFVIFASSASNLAPGDTNTGSALFVRDRARGTTTRLSLSAGLTGRDQEIGSFALSRNGRFIAFDTEAENVFVHDLVRGTTERVSVNSAGVPVQEPHGQFDFDGTDLDSISDDGRYIAFDSTAANLVPGDTNTCDYAGYDNCPDVFVRDRVANTTTRVSVSSRGRQANALSGWISEGGGVAAISGDGRFVAFDSRASNLAGRDKNGRRDVFRHDRTTGTTTLVSVRRAPTP